MDLIYWSIYSPMTKDVTGSWSKAKQGGGGVIQASWEKHFMRVSVNFSQYPRILYSLLL